MMILPSSFLVFSFFFFFNDTATTEIYTLSLHDALPISRLWLRLMCWTMVSSRSSPPIRMDSHRTMPDMDITATSVVPPPILTMVLAPGLDTGRPAPRAAATGSSIRKTLPAPALRTRASTARFSTWVVPYGTTQVEKRAVEALVRSAGAGKVFLIEEPVAAALGAGLPVSSPGANTIVNIGGGTTEVAVMSMSGIVRCESMRIGGDDLDDTIVQHIKRSHSLLIGPRQAEELKLAMGSVFLAEREPEGALLTYQVKGRNLITGLPKTVVVSAEEMRDAMREPVSAFLDAVRACLERTPPELAADIVDSGIVLTGGGALLAGLDTVLHAWTHLPVTISKEPVHCVIRGAGRAVEDLALLHAMTVPA